MRPHVARVRYPNELRRHPYSARAAWRFVPPDGPLEDVVDPQVLADLGDRLGGLLVLPRARAADDPEPMHPGEPSRHLLRHAIREVLVVRSAEVLERQHDEHAARGSAVRSRARMKAGEDPERREQPEGPDAQIRELALTRPPSTARWAHARWACGRAGERLGKKGRG